MITRSLLKLIAKIASIVLYILTIFSGFGGKFNPEFFTIPAIMTLIFPLLVILTLIVSICWLISRKFITGGLGLLALFLTMSSIRMAVPIGFPEKAPENAVTFKILTFNSLHFDDIRQPDSENQRAIHFLMESGADIICLQELKTFFEDWEMKKDVPPALLDSLWKIYPYRATHDGFNDLKVLSKYPVKFIKPLSSQVSFTPSFAAFRTDIKGNKLIVVNVHLTSYNLTQKEQNVVTDVKSVNSAKSSVKEFKQSIYAKMKESFRNRSVVADEIIETVKDVNCPIIICGDFNDVPASWTYRKFIDAGFKDAYSMTSFGPTPTFNKHLFLFHLDQILFRGNLLPLRSGRLKLDTSDHYPVEAEFAFVKDPSD